VESLLRAALPVLGPLVGAGLLAGIGIAIGLVLVIVPGLFLLTIWAVIVPVIVLERVPAMQSFGRSRELVRGSGWQVFGVIVVLFLLQIVLGSLVNAIFGAISDTFVVRSIGDLIVRILVGPLSALAAAVMYFELKAIRGEQVPGSATYTPSAPAPPTATPTTATPPEPSQPGA
jgi:hypothetical protein